MGNVYAFLDGDNIGIRLEELLSKNKTSEASLLSENIKIAMLEIDKILNSKPDVKIIIIGGDDVLIQYDHEKYGTDIIDEILNTFKVITGLSMSCGIGLTNHNSTGTTNGATAICCSGTTVVSFTVAMASILSLGASCTVPRSGVTRQSRALILASSDRYSC